MQTMKWDPKEDGSYRYHTLNLSLQEFNNNKKKTVAKILSFKNSDKYEPGKYTLWVEFEADGKLIEANIPVYGDYRNEKTVEIEYYVPNPIFAKDVGLVAQKHWRNVKLYLIFIAVAITIAILVTIVNGIIQKKFYC